MTTYRTFIDHILEFRPGSPSILPANYDWPDILGDAEPHLRWSWRFRAFKALFDYGSALVMLPVVATLAVMLWFLNPLCNSGPVFFAQTRMGRHGRTFRMVKFRTMSVATEEARDAHAPVEVHRITPLGAVMRKYRIDEIPNFINVLCGEMSVIGPRPDAVNHAETFSDTLMGYRERHRVKPGITGLAQVEMGYAEGSDATAIKTKYDNMYVRRSCGRLDVYIIMRTIKVMSNGFGAK